MRHDPSAPFGRDALAAPPRLGARHRAIALLIGAMAVKLAYFAALGRPVGCDCGLIWAMPDDPTLNSQVLLDPYTLMHLVSGMLVIALVRTIRPDWGPWTLMGAAIVSSTIWELVENLPPVVAAFNYDPSDPLTYSGDSILNAMADGLAVAAGALLALRMRTVPILLAALAVEIALSLWIADGLVIGILRALGLWS